MGGAGTLSAVESVLSLGSIACFFSVTLDLEDLGRVLRLMTRCPDLGTLPK